MSVIASKTGAIANIFKNSAPESTYGKVSRNNLDEDSFHSNLDQAIQKLSETEEALMTHIRIREDERFCQLQEIWSTEFGYTSMALTKNLPQRGIINHALNEYIKNGQFQRSFQKWNPQSLSCPAEPFHDLGFHKVIFLFFILCIGIVLALVTFIYERCSCKSNRSALTLKKVDLKLNPDELQDLIDIVQRKGGQKHDNLVRKLQTMQPSPP